MKFSPESASVRLRLRVDLDVLVPRHRLLEDFLTEGALNPAPGLVNMVVRHVLKQEKRVENHEKQSLDEYHKSFPSFSTCGATPINLARMVALYVLKQGV